ncbi:hypothetical protein JMG10_00540 [Nostoc ellipsosporum NOK]|nr:hypothetical protein [Nostoc ellipsosporum NOK]
MRSQTAEGLYEYFLVAPPDERVCEQLEREKDLFYNRFEQPKPRTGKPFITVSGFWAHDEMEDTLIRWLQRITGDIRSFQVNLNGFAACPPKHLCVGISENKNLRQLASGLQPIDTYVQSNACPPVRFFKQPHLPLAGALPHGIYDRVVQEYIDKPFDASFYLTELVLLRRREGYENNRQVAVFRLQPAEQL